MTAEEAIKTLKLCKTEVEEIIDNRDVMPCPADVYRCNDALHMAIEALECVNSSVFRDAYQQGRADAIEELSGIYQRMLDSTDNGYEAMAWCCAIGIIDDMRDKMRKQIKEQKNGIAD